MSDLSISSDKIAYNVDLCVQGEKDSVAEFEWDNLGTEIYKTAEKRSKPDSSGNGDNDGFITVTKRPKRSSESSKICIEGSSEICITSSNILPKQIAFAKLLRTNNIKNIIGIKYKNPYKVNINFDTRENAEALINCRAICDLGFRCRFLGELNISYGVIKQIDLDLEEKEINESFSCEYDIISTKRLRRVSDDGKWIDSETIRLCFRSAIPPTHVFGYGCRFKVERYNFPVTQCSRCWKFGHFRRTCPGKKIVCPKCGEGHDICETDKYKCVNCKGPHLAIDKSCPIFIKEKEIRVRMSEKNCPYKEALKWYYNKSAVQYDSDRIEIENSRLNTQHNNSDNKNNNNYMSYRDALLSNANMQHVITDSEGDPEPSKKTKRQKKKKKTRKSNIIGKPDLEEEEVSFSSDSPVESNIPDKKKGDRSNLIELLNRLKGVLFSEKSFNEKVKLIIYIIIDELKSYIVSLWRDGDLFKKMFDYNG